MWVIEVVHIETKEVVKTFNASSERDAERLERGLLHQINLTDYFVSAKEVEDDR